MFRILIAPNSFKECADSTVIANIFQTHITSFLSREKFKDFEIIKRPISDGGDGFTEVCRIHFNAEINYFTVVNPITGQRIKCPAAYDKKRRLLFVESANLVGMKITPKKLRNPLKLNSEALGYLIEEICLKTVDSEIKVDEVIIGVGGTSTNDLGIGAASVFGMVLYDDKGTKLKPVPRNFGKVSKLKLPEIKLPFKITAVTDVSNPLLGENGAAKVFARQKGASDEQINKLEKGSLNILKKMSLNGNRISKLSGAGGGLAAGLELFFNADCMDSEEFILKRLGVNGSLKPDVLITGEGRFDDQSTSTKAAGVMIKEFETTGKIFICSGNFTGDCLNWDRKNIQLINLGSFFSSSKESIGKFEEGIKKASQIIAGYILNTGKTNETIS